MFINKTELIQLRYNLYVKKTTSKKKKKRWKRRKKILKLVGHTLFLRRMIHRSIIYTRPFRILNHKQFLFAYFVHYLCELIFRKVVLHYLKIIVQIIR